MTGVKTLNPQCAIKKFDQDECLTTVSNSFKKRSLNVQHNVPNTQKRVINKTGRYRHVSKKKKSTVQGNCLKTKLKTYDMMLPVLSFNPHQSLVLFNEKNISSHSYNVHVSAFSESSPTSRYTKCSSLSTLCMPSCMEKENFQKNFKGIKILDEWSLSNASRSVLPSTLITEENFTVEKTSDFSDGNITKKLICNATKNANIPLYKTKIIKHFSPSRSPDGKQNNNDDFFETPKAPIRKKNRVQSLYRAILSSSLDQVKHCLEQGGDPNAKFFFNAAESKFFVGYTPPIFVAALLGHKEILQLLLNEGGCVNAVNFENQNSLHFLFNRSPSSYALPFTTHCPSYQSMQKNYAEFDDFMKTHQKTLFQPYEDIMSTGSNQNSVQNFPSITKSSSVSKPQTQQDKIFECIDILLKHGINIHAKDNKGWLPLDYAIQIYGLIKTHPLVQYLSK